MSFQNPEQIEALEILMDLDSITENIEILTAHSLSHHQLKHQKPQLEKCIQND
jgi:hypothetical protein